MALSTPSSWRKNRRRVNADINITPLVDVMLVLLVIFMVTAPMLMSSININLPEAGTKSINEGTDPVVISIDTQGKIYLCGKKISLSHLLEGLETATNGDLQAKIFIEGDKNLAYAEIVKIIADVNQAGFTKIVLITKVQDVK